MKQGLLNIIGGWVALSVAATAQASLSVPMGWYVEGNIGSSKLQNKNFPGASQNASGVGGNIDVGYKFMPYFAAELGYTYYPKTRIKVSGVKAGTDRHYSVDFAGKAILPIAASGAEVFAKIGAQRLSSKVNVTNSAVASTINLSNDSKSAFGPYLGIGASYSFMPELSANVQWARAKGNDSTGDMDLWSVGLTFIVD